MYVEWFCIQGEYMADSIDSIAIVAKTEIRY